MKLRSGESTTDCGHGVGRLHLLVDKDGSEKSRVLGAVIASLKGNHNRIDKYFLVIDPTGKAVPSMLGSALHSNEEGLSIPAKSMCKPLKGKLTHCQEKHKGAPELVVMDELAMMS